MHDASNAAAELRLHRQDVAVRAQRDDRVLQVGEIFRRAHERLHAVEQLIVDCAHFEAQCAQQGTGAIQHVRIRPDRLLDGALQGVALHDLPRQLTEQRERLGAPHEHLPRHAAAAHRVGYRQQRGRIQHTAASGVVRETAHVVGRADGEVRM